MIHDFPSFRRARTERRTSNLNEQQQTVFAAPPKQAYNRTDMRREKTCTSVSALRSTALLEENAINTYIYIFIYVYIYTYIYLSHLNIHLLDF